MIGRRQVFGLTAVGLASLWFGSRAEACSIVPVRRQRFSDRKCRHEIKQFVQLLNEAPSLTKEKVIERFDDMSVHIEPGWVDDTLGERARGDVQREYTFLQEFRKSRGTLDPRPIELEEINLIRQLRNRATYEFTLMRNSYHPADPEGCNGLFVHDGYYSDDRTAYLATFSANRLRTVRRFPEWPLHDAGGGPFAILKD